MPRPISGYRKNKLTARGGYGPMLDCRGRGGSQAYHYPVDALTPSAYSLTLEQSPGASHLTLELFRKIIVFFQKNSSYCHPPRRTARDCECDEPQFCIEGSDPGGDFREGTNRSKHSF